MLNSNNKGTARVKRIVIDEISRITVVDYITWEVCKVSG